MRAAAIQMDVALADVPHNLASAKRLASEAAQAGAKLIVLPEFFTSGIAFDKAMLTVASYSEQTRAFLRSLSAELKTIIGGSFLEYDGGEVYNTFLLTFPSGECYAHRKDIPTQLEHCYYTFGDQNNLLHTPIGEVGVALCWEMLRTDTLKRLANKADFILAGSCWWDLPEGAPAEQEPLRAYNQALAVETPITFAGFLGVPLIHAAHCSRFTAKSFPKADRLQTRRMVGAAQVIGAGGEVLARRTFHEGEGMAIADIYPQKNAKAASYDKERYWIPDLPQVYLSAWEKNNALGREYYQTVANPYYRDMMNKKERTT